MIAASKQRILIICQDYIGETMAGPGIRSWEFAVHLSKNHDVVIMTPNVPDVETVGFTLKHTTRNSLKREIQLANIVISQKISPKVAKLAKKCSTRIILDAYDPIAIEALEANCYKPDKFRHTLNTILLLEQSSSFIFADSVICASEKQRDLWFGVLSSMNKITPTAYDQDNSLRHLIDVVPFGLSSVPPNKDTTHALRKKFGLKDSDFVLLWGGGVWNWFDPLTLIKAVHHLQGKIPVKLVFMGIDHPNKNIPQMPMVKKAINKAKDLSLLGKSVFFNEGWVPYAERQGFLRDSDVGVSMHYDHLETRFSFRTRMLDYIWASLPIIATRGDSFAELIEHAGLGVVVEYQDSQSIAQAIEKLANNKAYYLQVQENLRLVQKDFYWDKCIQPLENMINHWATNEPERRISIYHSMVSLINLYGGKAMIIRKIAKKYLAPRQNLNWLVALYSSQNTVRLKHIKKFFKKH